MRILTVADKIVPEILDKVTGAPLLEGIELILGCGYLPPEYLERLRHL